MSPYWCAGRRSGETSSSGYIDDPIILKRLGKDEESRKLVKSNYTAAINSNPVWKHRFFDIEDVISDQRFNGRKNVCAHLFKYMSKCLTKGHRHATSSLKTIKDCKDHKPLVALYTHLCNKCFRNRDITYGKGFREMIGLLREKQEEKDCEESPWTYLGMVDESLVINRFKKRFPEDPNDYDLVR